MNPLGCLWTGLKILLSAIFVVMAGFGLVSAIKDPSWQAFAAVVFAGGMAALPWVMLLDERKRTFLGGLASIALGPMFVFLAYAMLIDGSSYPKACSGKRASCELFNWLYEVGGTPAVASPIALAGVMFFIGGVLMVANVLSTKARPTHE